MTCEVYCLQKHRRLAAVSASSKPTGCSLQSANDGSEGPTYDTLTPSAGATIRLKKSVLFCRVCYTNALSLIVSLPQFVVGLQYLHPCPRIEVFALQKLRPDVFHLQPSSLVEPSCLPDADRHLPAAARILL